VRLLPQRLKEKTFTCSTSLTPKQPDANENSLTTSHSKAMKTPMKLVVVAALAVVVASALVLKKGRTPDEIQPRAAAAATGGPKDGPAAEASSGGANKASPAANARLPRMVDLGAGKCIPCKMMKPILDDLKVNYADRFITEFIDVWENPDAGKKYGIEMIPTQIFYDAEGKERFRHVGFYSKEEILSKWRELGVDAMSKSTATAN